MGAKILLTAEEFLERYPDKSYELRRGEVIRLSPTNRAHGRVSARAAWILAEFVERHDLGEVVTAETGFRLSEQTVYAPDVAFVGKERLGDVGEGFYPFAPDLAVEVLSPGDTHQEVLDKVEGYLEAGTPLVWILDPKRKTVTAYEGALQNVRIFKGSDTLEAFRVLPGFSCPLSRFFP